MPLLCPRRRPCRRLRRRASSARLGNPAYRPPSRASRVFNSARARADAPLRRRRGGFRSSSREPPRTRLLGGIWPGSPSGLPARVQLPILAPCAGTSPEISESRAGAPSSNCCRGSSRVGLASWWRRWRLACIAGFTRRAGAGFDSRRHDGAGRGFHDFTNEERDRKEATAGSRAKAVAVFDDRLNEYPGASPRSGNSSGRHP